MRPYLIGLTVTLLFSFSFLKAENDSLWQLTATDFHAPYAPAPMANGCIGILPGKTPFTIFQGLYPLL